MSRPYPWQIKPISELSLMHRYFLSSLEWFQYTATLLTMSFSVVWPHCMEHLGSSKTLFIHEMLHGACIKSVLLPSASLALKPTFSPAPGSLPLIVPCEVSLKPQGSSKQWLKATDVSWNPHFDGLMPTYSVTWPRTLFFLSLFSFFCFHPLFLPAEACS